MKSQILELVKQKHISSDGKCGTYLVEIQSKLDIPAEEFEQLMIEMYNDEQIDIRMGINGFMAMKKIKLKKS
jgi:hypothetical protein